MKQLVIELKNKLYHKITLKLCTIMDVILMVHQCSGCFLDVSNRDANFVPIFQYSVLQILFFSWTSLLTTSMHAPGNFHLVLFNAHVPVSFVFIISISTFTAIQRLCMLPSKTLDFHVQQSVYLSPCVYVAKLFFFPEITFPFILFFFLCLQATAVFCTILTTQL